MTLHNAAQKERGRVVRTPHGRWALMNNTHFHWLTRFWWATGYEAGYEAGLRAAGKPLTTALGQRKRVA